MQSEDTTKIGAAHNTSYPPRTVYKYRCWNNRNHKKLLTCREVYFAPPSSFEDNKDARLSRERFSLTKNQIVNGYFTISKHERPDLTLVDHLAKATSLAEQTDLEELQNSLVEEYEGFDKNIGVLSLAMTADNADLWKSYASFGKGFCIGIDTELLFPDATRHGVVTYYTSLPQISVDEDWNNQIYKHIFCKESRWAFEDEYRVYKYKEKGLKEIDRCLRLSKEAISELIFGYDIDHTDLCKILNVCKAGGLNPRLMRAVIRDGNIDIVPFHLTA